MVKQEITAWRDWHAWWIETVQSEKGQAYFFRFEDLTSDPKSVMTDVFKFSLAVDTLECTVIEKRIDLLLAQKKEGKKVELYKPRESGVNKNAFRYSEEQLAWIKKTLDPLLRFFGYEDEFGLEKKESTNTLKSVNARQMEFSLVKKSKIELNVKDSYNVRSQKDSKLEDCYEGVEDRALPNFNNLCEKVTVQDRLSK